MIFSKGGRSLSRFSRSKVLTFGLSNGFFKNVLHYCGIYSFLWDCSFVLDCGLYCRISSMDVTREDQLFWMRVY